eukprot:5807164-Prymnesium_polylepis.1
MQSQRRTCLIDSLCAVIPPTPVHYFVPRCMAWPCAPCLVGVNRNQLHIPHRSPHPRALVYIMNRAYKPPPPPISSTLARPGEAVGTTSDHPRGNPSQEVGPFCEDDGGSRVA